MNISQECALRRIARGSLLVGVNGGRRMGFVLMSAELGLESSILEFDVHTKARRMFAAGAFL